MTCLAIWDVERSTVPVDGPPAAHAAWFQAKPPPPLGRHLGGPRCTAVHGFSCLSPCWPYSHPMDLILEPFGGLLFGADARRNDADLRRRAARRKYLPEWRWSFISRIGCCEEEADRPGKGFISSAASDRPSTLGGLSVAALVAPIVAPISRPTSSCGASPTAPSATWRQSERNYIIAGLRAAGDGSIGKDPQPYIFKTFWAQDGTPAAGGVLSASAGFLGHSWRLR